MPRVKIKVMKLDFRVSYEKKLPSVLSIPGVSWSRPTTVHTMQVCRLLCCRLWYFAAVFQPTSEATIFALGVLS